MLTDFIEGVSGVGAGVLLAVFLRSPGPCMSRALHITGTPHAVALCCDFFYPSAGGVENHVHQLALCLIRLGLKVIVVTHRYGSRTGVRWLAGGLKVYHVPFKAVYDGTMLPMSLMLTPLLRDIFVREGITIVHAHAVCTMSFEAIMLAALEGHGVVYTEHSNFDVTGALPAALNRLSQAVLIHADALISVSHACAANLAERCRLPPAAVEVIPNAVDASHFKPDVANVRPVGCVVVIVLTRLVWRKGTQLLAQLIPDICLRHADVHFVIGGDGPKRAHLESMVARHGLERRVELLGAVAHRDVPAVLTRGHVFLNTSLTEAFCITVLEAVCCGLRVVSTDVGGVAELLPAHMLHLTRPDTGALLAALDSAICAARSQPHAPSFHSDVASRYSWLKVAGQTACVYDTVGARPRSTFAGRLRTLLSADLGPLTTVLAFALLLLQHVLLSVLRCWRPADGVERAPAFPAAAWAAASQQYEPLPVPAAFLRELAARRTYVR